MHSTNLKYPVFGHWYSNPRPAWRTHLLALMLRRSDPAGSPGLDGAPNPSSTVAQTICSLKNIGQSAWVLHSSKLAVVMEEAAAAATKRALIISFYLFINSPC